jgi:hypothetical protein
VVGSENGEIGKGFREMLRPAKDWAIPVDDRVALAWIFKQCGTASSSVKPTSMGISDAVRILSDGARQLYPNNSPSCGGGFLPLKSRLSSGCAEVADFVRVSHPSWNIECGSVDSAKGGIDPRGG